MNNIQSPFAEVVESYMDHYTAHCWEWNQFPTFGSLVEVTTDSHTTLGIVSATQTGSIDPMRTPFPYQKTEAELLAEQPQIFAFLKTTFTVQIIGYIQDDAIHYMLPPTPCKIHAFVAPSSPQTVAQFFKQPDFLNLIFAFAQNIPNVDELLLAIIRQLNHQSLLTHEAFDAFCQTYSLLTGNDYRRLKLFLKRVERLAQPL